MSDATAGPTVKRPITRLLAVLLPIACGDGEGPGSVRANRLRAVTVVHGSGLGDDRTDLRRDMACEQW